MRQSKYFQVGILVKVGGELVPSNCTVLLVPYGRTTCALVYEDYATGFPVL